MTQLLRTTLKVADGGRIVIPAEIRQRLGMDPGSEVVMTVDDDHLVLMNAKAERRKARERVRDTFPAKSVSATNCSPSAERRPAVNEVNILDAPAVLAYLNQEHGHEMVEAVLDAADSWMSSVNYCEVLGKLWEKGMPVEEAAQAIVELGLLIVDFDRELALCAAAMRPRTMKVGASLGDRACLALAERTAPGPPAPVVYTAERSWNKLKWPFRIVTVRGAERKPKSS